VDPALADVLLELLERGCGVAAVEPADGHDRVAGGELDPGRGVRADGRRDPGVGLAVPLEQLDQRGAGRAGVEQPTEGAWPCLPAEPAAASTEPAASAAEGGAELAAEAAAPAATRP
jgi:hypothetical protein